MSSEIWKIGQETSAKDMYEVSKRRSIFADEIFGVQKLTQICKTMSASYDEVVDDQNEYLIEMEGELNSIEDLKEEIDEKIKQLYNEIKELDKKEQNGTITDEEREKLKTKNGELDKYMHDADSRLDEKSNQITTKNNEKANKHKSKQTIAKDYAETTIEKGTPLAETEVKTKSFWRCLFGGTGENKKKAGDAALEAGNELLDKVCTSEEIDSKIENNIKQIKTK